MDSKNRAIASIAISGTKGSINVKTTEQLAKKVKNTANLISNKLLENWCFKGWNNYFKLYRV